MLRALTVDGAAVAAVIGFIVYGWGGAGAALPLLLFFVSGTVLSKVTAARRRKAAAHADAPRGGGSASEAGLAGDGDGRRALQVLANGGLPAAAIVAHALTPANFWLAAFSGALAAVTADTWATEIGALSARPPVLITTGKRVNPGRSGAVSLAGTIGGIAGALTLALGVVLSITLWPVTGVGSDAVRLPPPLNNPGPTAGLTQSLVDAGSSGMTMAVFLLAVVVGGIAGLFADSFLGATVQARFRCTSCHVDTEHPVHRCGAKAQHVSGLRFCTNDVVNFFAAVTGALGSGVMLYLVRL